MKNPKYRIVFGLNLILSLCNESGEKCVKFWVTNPANSATVSLHKYVSVLNHSLQIIANVIMMESSGNVIDWLHSKVTDVVVRHDYVINSEY